MGIEILSTPRISQIAIKQAFMQRSIRIRILYPYRLHFLPLASLETNQPKFVEHQKRSFHLHEGKSKLADITSTFTRTTKDITVSIT